MKKIAVFVALLSCIATLCSAQNSLKSKSKRKIVKDDISTDALIFSFLTNPATTPRFSWIYNANYTYRTNFNKKFAVRAGLAVKNVGTSQKSGSTRTISRYYTLGVPVGLMFGNIKKHNVVIVEGGVDMPFHHKLKSWKIGDKSSTKEKQNEWFPDYARSLVPHIGVAYSRGLVGVKFTQYLRSFENNGNPGKLSYVSLFLNTDAMTFSKNSPVRKKIDLKSRDNSL